MARSNPDRPGNGQYWAQEVAADNSTDSLTVLATVKHNGVTVETQQLRYRRAQETLQWDAAGNLTDDAVLAFT